MSSSSNPNWLSFQQNASMISEMLLQAPSVGSMSAEAESNGNQKVYVEHNYVDHYNDPIYRPHDGSTKRRGPRGGVLVPFPEKLYQMLNQISEDGDLDQVVSWQPHGRCFVVHQPERFVKEVMPRYFSQTKLTSFQRQVNLYGFRRLTTGTDRNGYYHELFLRGRPDLLKKMTRVRVKGIGCKLAPSPATEPNFYRLPTCQKNKMADMLVTGESSTPATSSLEALKTSSCSKLASSGGSSTGGFLEAYMASKLGQAPDLLPMTTRNSNSLFLQVSGRRTESSAIPCKPKSFGANATPMAAFSSTSSLPSFHPTDGGDDDLMPLTSAGAASAGGFLMDNSMQDDIINLLSSCGELTPPNNNSASVQPPQTHSSGNILSDIANFWEI